MIMIRYHREGAAFSDFELDDCILFLTGRQDEENYIVDTSSSNLVTAIKLAIVRGKLDPEKVKFKFGDKLIDVNRYGAIIDWPDGFADIESKMCEEILLGAIAIRKRERSNRNGSISQDKL